MLVIPLGSHPFGSPVEKVTVISVVWMFLETSVCVTLQVLSVAGFLSLNYTSFSFSFSFISFFF